jgi:hypothetical protein
LTHPPPQKKRSSRRGEKCIFGVFGLVWFGLVWFGLVWFGLVWFGLVWFGWVWFGLVWFGLVWFGLVWFGLVWFVLFCFVLFCFVLCCFVLFFYCCFAFFFSPLHTIRFQLSQSRLISTSTNDPAGTKMPANLSSYLPSSASDSEDENGEAWLDVHSVPVGHVGRHGWVG